MGDGAGHSEFQRDPLTFLDRAFAQGGSALRLAKDQVLVAEASAAREVLVNRNGLYEAHSDFFRTGQGYLEPRELQETIGRSARALLDARRLAANQELPALIEREITPSSRWPDAGNWLAFRHLGPALALPHRCPDLLPWLDEIVRRAVLAGARERYSRLSRAWFRFRTLAVLEREIKQRRAQKLAAAPEDVLDVVATADPKVRTRALAEVFISFVFATAGSVGFVLGWSLYLLGRHPETTAKPAWIVREALRLWPVAWLLGRRPAFPHDVAGEAVTPLDQVVVCPYAIQRNPRHWHDPQTFRPERWGEPYDSEAFLPFGWGPHRCVAGSLSMSWVEEVVTLLIDRYRMTFTFSDHPPTIAAALAPPRFEINFQGERPFRSTTNKERP